MSSSTTSVTYQVTNQRTKGKKGGYKNKYLFANKQQDDETDLQYFEKRYYDNRIGRFTTEDSVFWEVGLTKRPNQYFTDSQSWNTYSYVRNNPVNLVDPSGEIAIAAAPAVVFVFTGPVGLFLGGITVVGTVIGALSVGLSKSSNNSTNNSNTNNQGQAKTGAGQTNQGNISQVQVSTASPPPSGGGPKKPGNGNNQKPTNQNTSQIKTTDKTNLPKSVQETFKQYDKNGWKNLGDRQGGGTWRNEKSQLPTNTEYQEFDINIKQTGQNRDMERFVRGSDGSVYYTDNHYGTFTEITP